MNKYPRPTQQQYEEKEERSTSKEHIVNSREHIFSLLHYAADKNYTFEDIIIRTYHNYTYKRDIVNILFSLFTSANPTTNDFSHIK